MSCKEGPLLSCLRLLVLENRRLIPSLWARIYIAASLAALSLTAPYTFHPTIVHHVEEQAEAIRKWLHRSGDLPLYISAGFPIGPHILGLEDVDGYALGLAIKEIFPLSRGWKEVGFRAYAPVFVD